VELREGAAREARQWVRLTRVCNNRCLFCLDAGAQDGSVVDLEAVFETLAAGRRRGAARAVLSGGEPTLHPRFLEIVRHAQRLGYSWIQVVTNGRMFAYERFLAEAVAGGLCEITFSLPAHRPALFDALVGVPGAFGQTLAGLDHALAHPQLVVSVDVVLNGRNIEHLADILEFYLERGVREFDLLQMVPFGRAFDPQHPNGGPLVYDPEQKAAYLQAALRKSVRPGVVLWTNRLDPPHLEGFERLIQDPHKLRDEVRGRLAVLRRFVRGERMRCRHPARCRLCFLRRYCTWLMRQRDTLQRAEMVFFKVSTPQQIRRVFALWERRSPRVAAGLWIRAARPQSAAEMVRVATGLAADAGSRHRRSLAMVVDIASGLEAWPHALDALFDRCEPRRLIVHRAADVNRLEAETWTGRFVQPTLAVGLNRDTAQTLPMVSHHRFRVSFEERSRLSASLEADVDARSVFAAAREAGNGDHLQPEDIPACLCAGLTPQVGLGPWIEADVLDADGQIDPLKAVDFFIRQGYRVYSLRCKTCRVRESCPGLPINLARNVGLGVLEPF
jgi:pyruvate-formate lyase-activating enzyme